MLRIFLQKPSIDSSPTGDICSALPYNVNITWTNAAGLQYLIQYRKDSGVWTDSPNGWLAIGSSSDSFNLTSIGTYDFRLQKQR